MDIAISRNGIPIRLTSERRNHITLGHPEIAGYYAEILETVRNPDVIYEGANDAKIAIKKLKETFAKFIVTIYKEMSDTDGFIITAHFITRLPEFKNKRILWIQQN